MNELLDRVIKESGEMWATVRDRTDPNESHILVKLSPGFGGGLVYELTLPKGEGHPFWRINEREISAQESHELTEAFHAGDVDRMGDLRLFGDRYIRTIAYICNGRKAGWTRHIEFVEILDSKVTPVLASPVGKDE